MIDQENERKASVNVEEQLNEVENNVPEENVEEVVNDTKNESSETVVDELEELKQKCSDLNDKNLRLMAEFDNFRKRTLKERADLIKTAGESILVDMLPLIDDFERGLKAMENADNTSSVKEGVELIYNKFSSFLQQKGVKVIETESADFNTEYHEAITTFPAPTEDLKGKIIDCVSKGYTLNEKVIRFSKVVVGE
jgi:molecular chaperone GrpE